MRNYNLEFRESEERKYAYDFDHLMHDYMMRVFSPFFRGGKALEMGCFEGEFTARIMSAYGDVTVIDASSELLAKAQARTGEGPRFVLSTFETADLGKRKFDAIFLIHTLEHLDQPELVLQQVKKWLAPMGRLFVAVPNANALSRQIAVKMGLIDYNTAVTAGEHDHGHRKTYNLDGLEFEIKNGGLRIEQSGGVFLKPFANFQFDLMIKHGVIDRGYLEGCFELGKKYPDFCATIYAICCGSEMP